MAWRVLVTARAFWVNGRPASKALQSAGCDVVQSPRAGPLSIPELIQQLRGCDAVIGSSDPYVAEVFGASPQLKVVSRCGVGIDSVDLAGATGAGVVITNTPGAMSEAVADYAIGLLLAVARKIADGHILMRSGGWGEYPGTLVWEKTLGLIGCGQIGRAVAIRAAGFRMRILVYDPALSADARAKLM
ncbi:MAG TPA: NAD(P)-dependent oxidoreductase, partial [Chthonomonadales bacterium]|nr:NAD(P)-dependent oxidoreductase [Chthonomonadales bacterium]